MVSKGLLLACRSRTISSTLSRASGRTVLPTPKEAFIHCVHQSLRSCQDFAQRDITWEVSYQPCKLRWKDMNG